MYYWFKFKIESETTIRGTRVLKFVSTTGGVRMYVSCPFDLVVNRDKIYLLSEIREIAHEYGEQTGKHGSLPCGE